MNDRIEKEFMRVFRTFRTAGKVTDDQEDLLRNVYFLGVAKSTNILVNEGSRQLTREAAVDLVIGIRDEVNAYLLHQILITDLEKMGSQNS